MNKGKKIFLIIAIALISILLITGVTYAALSYKKEGETQELIVGDIWMKYEETNQLVLEDAMPTSIENYSTYKVNPVMKTQEVVVNELIQCINLLGDIDFSSFDEGSTSESFCKGTGTALGGMTFQQLTDLTPAEYQHQEFLDAGIIIKEGESYVVNPVIATQEIMENELTRCINLYTDMGIEGGLDSGSDVESFCKGEGTIMNGMTLQQFWDENNQEDGFMDFIGNYLIKDNIIIPRIENLPYFEFTISGKNTYTKKDIWYEIVLNHGEEHEIRTTRISDDLLRFSLIEIKDGIETTVINNRKYDDLNNKRIWVNIIDKNTNEEIEITYRLYMWIDENTIIGNNKEDYTLEEWKDVFASIKVNVIGDFNEKEVVLSYEEMYDVTDESCFATVEINAYTLNSNLTDNELDTCVTLLKDDFGKSIDEGEDFESFCKGTGTRKGNTFQIELTTDLFYSESQISSLEENNIISTEKVIAITDYDESCGSDIVIPRTINGYNVNKLGYRTFDNKYLESVVFPNTIKLIQQYAFVDNYITKVEIPNSVIYLDCDAFDSRVIIKKSNDLLCSRAGRPQ